MKRNWRSDKFCCSHWLIGWMISSLFLVIACNQPEKRKTTPMPGNEKTVYYCPMHPEAQQDHPGKCPKCNMDLVLKQSKDGISAPLSPVNESVITQIKTIKPVWKTVSMDYEAQGYIDYDNRRAENVSSLYSGRIEKLYIKYSYQPVKKGDKLFDVYSPELVTAQQNLIYLLENDPESNELIKNTKEKLKLLGFTESQLMELQRIKKVQDRVTVYSKYDGHIHAMNENQSMPGEMNPLITAPLSVKEGMYISKGQTVFELVDPHDIVAVLQIKAEDVPKVKKDQQVELAVDNEQEKNTTGTIDFIEPVFMGNAKTMRVRVYLENLEHQHKIGSLVKGMIKGAKEEALWIPKSALLDLGKNKIVWVKVKGEFKARQVNTGVSVNDSVEIYDGISELDEIAVEAHYLSDSENQIKIERNKK